MEQRKKCTNCKKYKPLKDFHKLKSAKDGRRTKCKLCRQEETEQYYATNKSRILAYCKQRAQTPRGKKLHRQACKRYAERKRLEYPFKLCQKCGRERPLIAFSRKGNRLHARCKSCRQAQYQKEKQRAVERASAYYHENKLEILAKETVRRRLHPERQLLISARRRAKKKRIKFDINIEDIHVPETCPVLGIKLSVSSRTCRQFSPSLDRIDSSRGYVKGNIVVVSFKANTMKSDATVDEMGRLHRFYRDLRAATKEASNAL